MDGIFSHGLAAAHQIAARINTAYPQTEEEIKEHNQRCVNGYIVVRDLHEQAHLEPDPVFPSQITTG